MVARFEEPSAVFRDLDAYEERAAIAEYDGGLPRLAAEQLAAKEQGYAAPASLIAATVGRWRDGLLKLSTTPIGRGHRGATCIRSALRFMDEGWANAALLVGWPEHTLVGVDGLAPWERLDLMGAAFFPHRVQEVRQNHILFTTQLRFYRASNRTGAVVLWKTLANRSAGAKLKSKL